MGNEIMQAALTIICSALGGGAVVSLITFLIDRKDRRDDTLKELNESISNIYSELAALRGDMEKSEAINARVRILRASDKLRTGEKHSKEYYDQVIEDINEYERYCVKYPDFKNNKAIHAIAYINEAYDKAMKSNSFI